MGLYHHVATCSDCDFHVDAANAQGVAAQHARKRNHQVSVELGILYRGDS